MKAERVNIGRAGLIIVVGIATLSALALGTGPKCE